MASNFHSELPNEQLHNPKDFSVATPSSVLTKSNGGELDWNTSPYRTATTITCGEDVAGGLHNKCFYVFWDGTTANRLEVHFAVTGNTTAFTPTAGFTAVPITISANDSAITIASAIAQELRRLTTPYSFSATTNGSGKVTFSGMTNAPDTTDSTTNFFFENSKQWIGTTVLTSTAGVIEWLPGGGGSGAVASVSAVTPGTSTGTPIDVTPTTGSVTVKSNAYAGTTNVGHVPTGGSATTFLRGDGTWQTPATGGAYTAGNGIDSTNLANNIIQVDSSVVRNTGNQTIGGTKTFSTVPIVGTAQATDNSTKAASTAWITAQAYGKGTVKKVTAGNGLSGGDITDEGTIAVDSTVVRTSGNQTIRGVKTFGDIPLGVTPPARDNTTSLATTGWVQNELQNYGTGVTSVTASTPILSSGGNTPNISMPAASATKDGYLSSRDFAVFNGKQDQIALTNTGQGASTLVGTVLNVPLPVYEQSLKGWLRTAQAGDYINDVTKGTTNHAIDINKLASSAIDTTAAVQSGFHTVLNNETFRILSGYMLGPFGSVIKVKLHSCDLTCDSKLLTTKLEGTASMTCKGKDTPVCWEIKAPFGSKILFKKSDILVLSLEVSPSSKEEEEYYYQAIYSSTY